MTFVVADQTCFDHQARPGDGRPGTAHRNFCAAKTKVADVGKGAEVMGEKVDSCALRVRK
jgi:hypothetical protein